jgi:hypothetical protein
VGSPWRPHVPLEELGRWLIAVGWWLWRGEDLFHILESPENGNATMAEGF